MPRRPTTRPAKLPALVSEGQAALSLRISVRTLERWRAAGCAPPHYRLGPRRLGYDLAEIACWARGRRVAQQDGLPTS